MSRITQTFVLCMLLAVVHASRQGRHMQQLSGQVNGAAQASQSATADRINAAINNHAQGKKAQGSAQPAPIPKASNTQPIPTNPTVTTTIANAPKSTQGTAGGSGSAATAAQGATSAGINRAASSGNTASGRPYVPPAAVPAKVIGAAPKGVSGASAGSRATAAQGATSAAIHNAVNNAGRR